MSTIVEEFYIFFGLDAVTFAMVTTPADLVFYVLRVFIALFLVVAVMKVLCSIASIFLDRRLYK